MTTQQLTTLEQKILKRLNIDAKSVEELRSSKKWVDVQLQALDWVHFAQRNFKSPRLISEALKLEVWQKLVLRYIQTGDKKYIILICPRGFGKSVVVAVAVAIIMIQFPGCKIGIYAMGQRQTIAMVKMVKYFIMNSRFKGLIPKRGSGLSQTQDHLELTNSSDVQAFPCTESIRGRHNDFIFMDEMSRIPDNIINEVIRPTGRQARREVGLSTPAGMIGEFYKASQNQDMYKVFQVKATDVSWMTPEKLAEEEARLGPFAAKQELYAIFLPTGDTIFQQEWINNSYKIHQFKRRHWDTGYIDGSRRHMAMGADFGRDRDWAAFAIGHYNQYGVFMLDYLEAIRKAPYPTIEARLVDLIIRFKVEKWAPDATGLGEPIIENIYNELERQDYHGLETITNRKPGKEQKKESKGWKRPGYVFTGESKLDLINHLVVIYSRGVISVPFHFNDNKHEAKVLENELVNFQMSYEQNSSGRTSLKLGTQSEHDDRLVAVALLCRALVKIPYKFTKPQAGYSSF